MGAGRKAAQSMQEYLGIRDTSKVYLPELAGSAGKFFGIDATERNYGRIRIADAQPAA
jgi:glutamate synthase (NADPH) small chain